MELEFKNKTVDIDVADQTDQQLFEAALDSISELKDRGHEIPHAVGRIVMAQVQAGRYPLSKERSKPRVKIDRPKLKPAKK